jgi:hypothetical protein
MLGAEDTILAFFISVDYASNRNRAGGACVPFTTHLTLKYALRLQRHAAVRVEDDSAGERGLRAHGGDR